MRKVSISDAMRFDVFAQQPQLRRYLPPKRVYTLVSVFVAIYSLYFEYILKICYTFNFNRIVIEGRDAERLRGRGSGLIYLPYLPPPPPQLELADADAEADALPPPPP